MKNLSKSCYIGIDIQIRRNCCDAVIDDSATLIDSGWLSSAEADAADLLKQFASSGQVVEGRGSEVGGGDGLGTIVLPRPIPDPVVDEVTRWPE